ncbi:hypothetical protein FRB90_004842 [Tulasnella sp. 427]|nr:hypothetical protein FRB90_004842 [Tulasnella sp. 427]
MAASTNDQDHPRPRSSRSTPSDLRTKLSLARNNVVATLKTTDWPNDMAEVEGLLRAVETPLQLERLPRDESRFLPESKAAIERHIEDFTMVHALLRKESAKYGTKGKGTSRWFRSLGTKTDLIECATTLRACQFIIEKSTATLNDHLRTLEANNDSRTSADKTESPPETDQPSGTTDQDRKRRQRWNAVISGTHMTLQVAEGLSKLIPVVGPFVEATASAGIKIVEMVQVMSGNIEVSENLKEDVCRLYDILDKFTNPGGEPEVRIMEKAVEELQKFEIT